MRYTPPFGGGEVDEAEELDADQLDRIAGCLTGRCVVP